MLIVFLVSSRGGRDFLHTAGTQGQAEERGCFGCVCAEAPCLVLALPHAHDYLYFVVISVNFKAGVEGRSMEKGCAGCVCFVAPRDWSCSL